MSIIAYTGLMGSGKTYGVVENVILRALEQGRTVITNIPVRKGYLEEDYPKGKLISFEVREPLSEEWNVYEEREINGRKRQVLVSNFWDLDRHEQGVIWVIDEAWRYWKNGTKASAIPEKEMQFFTEHRHCVGPDGRTNEIVLVTQDLQQVASCIRDLVEETYTARKLTALGSNKKFRVDVYTGPHKLSQGGQPLRQLFGRYKPEIYKYYRSHTKNKTDFAAGMEEKADDRANIWKSPFIRYVMPAAFVLIGWGVWNVYGYFNRDLGGNPQPEPVQEQPVQPAGSGTLQKAVIRRDDETRTLRETYQSKFEIEGEFLPLSNKWRIVGEVNGVYWIWGETGTRKIHSRICAKTRRTGEPFCVIEGKMVTYYSYKEPERTDQLDRSYVGDVADSFQ